MPAQYVAPGPLGLYSDAARRIADAVALHLQADYDGTVGRWVAFALADGASDGTTYEWKADAMRHQLYPELCCYLKILPDGMSPRGAELFLKFNRELHDAGMRMTDPDEREVIMPTRAEQYQVIDGSRAQQVIEREWAAQLAVAQRRGVIDPRLAHGIRKAMGL